MSEEKEGGISMCYCPACRPIEKGDLDNPELHFGTCQECGRNNHAIQQGYYDDIPHYEGQMRTIKKVKNFSVGDIVVHDGKRCEITKFMTRYSVCIKNLEYLLGDFNTANVSVRDIKEANDGKNRKH